MKRFTGPHSPFQGGGHVHIAIQQGTWVVADTRFTNGDVAGTMTVLPALAQH
jgi:hypothetical protein